MRTIKIFFLLFAFTGNYALTAQPEFDTPYGSNEEVGKYVTVNGINMYYEEYGEGEPILMIHGNGGSIHSMRHQIEYFKANYRVIAADSRGHGKSELNTDSLTYLQLAHDWAELVTQLNLEPVKVIGWSDGGIVGLLMGIHHPDKVDRLVAMGANLRPDTTALYPWAVTDIRRQYDEATHMLEEKDTTKNWVVRHQQLELMVFQPTIATSELSKIEAPVLIIAGDQDVIREEHTVEMFQHISHAHLCILPGGTHYAPRKTPEEFNKISEKFLFEPFKRPDSDWTK